MTSAQSPFWAPKDVQERDDRAEGKGKVPRAGKAGAPPRRWCVVQPPARKDAVWLLPDGQSTSVATLAWYVD